MVAKSVQRAATHQLVKRQAVYMVARTKMMWKKL